VYGQTEHGAQDRERAVERQRNPEGAGGVEAVGLDGEGAGETAERGCGKGGHSPALAAGDDGDGGVDRGAAGAGVAGCGEQFVEPEMKRNITMCGTDPFVRVNPHLMQ
jgi:hypothetical protein